MSISTRRPGRAAIAGFTLLETMIAMLIGGFGLISIARLQITMQGESDQAKQVSEATFLGQQRIDQMRAFQQISAADAGQLAAGSWGYENIASSSQTVTGVNATYTVGATIANDPGGKRFKTALVNVAWTDRGGNARTVNLSTVIAGLNPQTALELSVPPAGTPVRRPKDRNLNVPVPARDITGTGTSAFEPPGASSNFHVVFSNTTGAVTQLCTGAGLDYAGWTCTDVSGYLLTGFISFDGQANATPSSPIDLAMTVSEGTLYACYDDSALATKTYAGFITYTCIVLGNDHDSNASTPSRWSGTATLSGITIGTSASTDKVCRYSGDYDGSGSINNYEHPATYAQVAESLENQNYVIFKGNAACPTGSLLAEMTVQHQP